MTTLGFEPQAIGQRVRQGRFLAVAAMLWAAPVLATLVEADLSYVLLFTSLAAAICAAAILRRPQRALIALPFYALLSPMTGLLDIAGSQVLYSDLLFVLLLAQAAFVVVPALGRSASQGSSGYFIALVILFVVSVAIGLASGYLISAKPLVYLLQLILIFVYTRAYVCTPEDWLEVLWSWIVATAFGSVILLQAYSAGRNLDNLKEGDLVPAAAADDLLSLFRATYYYSGIHYVLGLGIVWLLMRLVFPAPLRLRLAQVLGLLLLLLALIAMVNKTAMAAVVLAATVTMVVLLGHFKQQMLKAILWMAALATVGSATLGWQYYQLSQETQLDLIVDRLGSSSSLSARFDVYAQAMQLWISSPTGVTVGFGPDFLDNSGDPTYATPMKVSKESGYEEGTVDSAWLSYLIELGLPGAFLLALQFGKSMKQAVHKLKSSATLDRNAYAAATLIGGLSYLAIAMTTQMLGYSKTSWLPFQVIFVSFMAHAAGTSASARQRD